MQQRRGSNFTCAEEMLNASMHEAGDGSDWPAHQSVSDCRPVRKAAFRTHVCVARVAKATEATQTEAPEDGIVGAGRRARR
jgi:hypothetical protein